MLWKQENQQPRNKFYLTNLNLLNRDTRIALVIKQTIHKTWIPFTAKVGGELTIQKEWVTFKE